MIKKPSDNSVARASVSKMEKYVKDIPLSKVPINQFKKASRKRICKELGITYSTIGSNAKLATLFEGLDIILGAQPSDQKKIQTKDMQFLGDTINRLESCIATLIAENKCLRNEMNRYNHFVNFGRMAR